MLENLAHNYTHPSILDVKLGTVMFAPDARPEKRKKMEAKAAEGTSLATGMRLTGCQVGHSSSHFQDDIPDIPLQSLHQS